MIVAGLHAHGLGDLGGRVGLDGVDPVLRLELGGEELVALALEIHEEGKGGDKEELAHLVNEEVEVGTAVGLDKLDGVVLLGSGQEEQKERTEPSSSPCSRRGRQ